MSVRVQAKLPVSLSGEAIPLAYTILVVCKVLFKLKKTQLQSDRGHAL